MKISNSISVFIGENFIIWSGTQGSAIVRQDTIVIEPLTMNGVTLPLTASNIRLTLWAIQ